MFVWLFLISSGFINAVYTRRVFVKFGVETFMKTCQTAPDLLYAFFWVILRHLNFICRRFGTLCLFHFHRRVGLSTYEDGTDRVFRKVGIWNSDDGELPRRKHTTFRKRGKFEIKKLQIWLKWDKTIRRLTWRPSMFRIVGSEICTTNYRERIVLLPWQFLQYLLHCYQRHMHVNHARGLHCCVSMATIVPRTRHDIKLCVFMFVPCISNIKTLLLKSN
jgi:hypothetical protein